MTAVGIVIIGRNEGYRLVRCLTSIQRLTDVASVYVDSGSTDGSVERARSMIGSVVKLDAARPFTAARGRNEGAWHLLEHHREMRFIQFVDGDCALLEHWIAAACRHLLANPSAAIVCGGLRERDRASSIYCRLCDMEWNRPSGIVDTCGGIFMIRTEAYTEVGGFDERISAGEEPELCARLRERGWQIHRIHEAMAVHDSGMVDFAQWWKRAVRSGQGSLESALRGGGRSAGGDVRRLASVALWTIGLPGMVVGGLWLIGNWSAVLLAAYPLQWERLRRKARRQGVSPGDARLSATFIFIAKLAALVGAARWLFHGASRRHEKREGNGETLRLASSQEAGR